jgi:hypothetical protein
MIFDLPSAFWIVRLGMAGMIFCALKAAWHWHSSTEILTRADLAGLCDGRSVTSYIASSAAEQAEQNAKGSLAAACAGLLAAIVGVAGYF